jgi:hypothetical protein
MARTAQNSGFDDRVRFNWGYHDAASDAKRGQARKTVLNGGQDVRTVSREFDEAYYDGYLAGLRHWNDWEYNGDSTAAWNDRTAAVLIRDIQTA